MSGTILSSLHILMNKWSQSKIAYYTWYCRTDVTLLLSHSVVSSFLWPHGLQHARLHCPLLFPGVCSNSCPLSQWCEAIQPSHPLSSPSPPALNLSQHQGLLQWVGSLHQVAKVLEFQLQHQCFQWIFRIDFL